MAGASLVLAKDSFWKPACHLPVPAVQPPPQGLCLRSRAADAEPGSGFLHSVQRARVANRLIPVWSTEARGLAPLPKEKGGHPIDKVLNSSPGGDKEAFRVEQPGLGCGLVNWGHCASVPPLRPYRSLYTLVFLPAKGTGLCSLGLFCHGSNNTATSS